MALTLSGKPIGLGIIGASPAKSWAAIAHIPAVQQLPDDFAIVALSTSRRSSAEEAGKLFGVAKVFDNHQDLLRQPEVDLTVVSVEVGTHRELVTAALEAGEPVLCEWPLGKDLAEAEAMAQLARDRGLQSFIMLQSRAAPALRYMRDLIADGFIGRVLSTSYLGSGLFWGPQVEEAHLRIQDAGNAVTLLTITTGHRLDMSCHLLGEFEWLQAMIACQMDEVTVRQTGARVAKSSPDQIVVQGQLTGGAVLNYHLRASGTADTKLLWEINGTQGDLLIRDPSATFGAPVILARRGEADALAPLEIPQSYFAFDPAQVPPFASHIGHAYAQIAKDVRTSSTDAPTFEEAVTRHRMLNAIERAAASGGRQRYL